jgi:hypothetical protein
MLSSFPKIFWWGEEDCCGLAEECLRKINENKEILEWIL